MKKLHNLVRNCKQLVFVDLEGTQFSHELIAIGAIKVTLTRKGTIKRKSKNFKHYVKPKGAIGRYVRKLTGITQELLDEKGLEFEEVMELFKKFVGRNADKTKYVTFGNHDLRIFQQSAKFSSNPNNEFVNQIAKRNIDLSAVISEYVRNGRDTYSLVNLCKLFGVPVIEPAHDPLNDALMLAGLYDSFYLKTDIIIEKYHEILKNPSKFTRPHQKLFQKLRRDGTVTLDDFEKIVREEIE